MLHKINIPEEAGEQRASGKKYCDTVRAKRISVGESARGKRRPQAHQYSGDDADDDALARNFFVLASEFAVGFAVEDDGDHRADNADRKQRKVPSLLLDVTEDHADHERDADGNGEGDRKSGHVDGRDEEQVSEIEDHSGNQRPPDVGSVGRVYIVEEAGRAVVDRAHGEGVDQRGEENADGVIPVKQLEAVVLNSFKGIGPGAPTGRGNYDHQKSGAEHQWCEH
jgi:hypothetical protein